MVRGNIYNSQYDSPGIGTDTQYLVFFCGLFFIANAKVTIGSGIEPRNTTLLDLKQSGGTNKDENSGKGLGLPCVKLVDSDTFLTGYTSVEEANSVGVMVYNTDNTTLDGEGVYTWNGTKWKSASGSSGTSLANYKIKSVDYLSEQLLKVHTMSWNSIRATITVEVSAPGAYQIVTDKVNGIVYEALGLFEKAGDITVDLIASGTSQSRSEFPYKIVQPAVSNTVGFKSFVIAPNGSGNTSLFSYMLVADKVTQDAGQPVNITLTAGSTGTPPTNKTVKWYVDGCEYTTGSMGSVSLAGDVMTIVENGKISRSVYDSDALGQYFVTSTIHLNWTIPFAWGSAGRVGDYDVYVNLVPPLPDGVSIIQMPKFVISSEYCRANYGPTARLSTLQEMNARVKDVIYRDMPSTGWKRTGNDHIYVISQSLLFDDLYMVWAKKSTNDKDEKWELYTDALVVVILEWNRLATPVSITSKPGMISLGTKNKTTLTGISTGIEIGHSVSYKMVTGFSWVDKVNSAFSWQESKNAMTECCTYWAPIIYGCSLPVNDN